MPILKLSVQGKNLPEAKFSPESRDIFKSGERGWAGLNTMYSKIRILLKKGGGSAHVTWGKILKKEDKEKNLWKLRKKRKDTGKGEKHEKREKYWGFQQNSVTRKLRVKEA